jgi:hypothetical protein
MSDWVSSLPDPYAIDWEDPVAIAIFAPEAEVAAYSEDRKLSLLLRLAGNDRLTDAEFRRFAQLCAAVTPKASADAERSRAIFG